MRSAFHLLVVAILLFGGAWPVTKAALAHATPMWFAVGRAGLAAVVSALLLAALGRLHWPRRRDMPSVLALGLLQLGVFFVLAHAAVAMVQAGRTAIISAVVTYWLIPLSVLVLGEKVPPHRWVAAGLGLAGVAVLAGPWSVDWTDMAQLLGHLMLMAAALFWTLAIITTRKYPPASSVFELLPWCFTLATVFILPFALVLEPDGGIFGPSWPFMLYIGLVVAPIGTWCVIEVGRRLPGAVASVAFLLVPAFGVLVSHLWLREPLGWDMILGGGLIVASVVLAARESGEQPAA
ncbi:DMT family transporter [Roseomonas sp. HJA6]|uniref:DMT family transporter n=1 Tax=Roseomonas alba TaxID=2846776 RepID=A0ABS7A1Y1_9PROT|nr:DMT family transporter [Neoroseomonas alba]MBW6396313.1 DMT family transporter [Neoroseomonas alba]